ncbi:MAG TPA: thymidylate kinase [Candidatus Paceibacterota bacterium]|nr:thymidylate kinase [Candidatus Paceibacterota bacterium]
MPKGKFIVIEGTDGTGKGTQTKLLVDRLMREGYAVRMFDFPRYGNPSAALVEKYLRGEMGGLSDVPPEVASMFYAHDRRMAAPDIRRALAEGSVVISNRYVASNLGHQGSKFDDDKSRVAYFHWDYETEFGYFGIPKPDLNLILHVPPEIAQKRVDAKVARQYIGGKKRDLHETDLGHLERSERVYLQLAKLFPGQFRVLECVVDGCELTEQEVHERVWKIVRKSLSI